MRRRVVLQCTWPFSAMTETSSAEESTKRGTAAEEGSKPRMKQSSVSSKRRMSSIFLRQAMALMGVSMSMTSCSRGRFERDFFVFRFTTLVVGVFIVISSSLSQVTTIRLGLNGESRNNDDEHNTKYIGEWNSQSNSKFWIIDFRKNMTVIIIFCLKKFKTIGPRQSFLVNQFIFFKMFYFF